MADVVHHIDLSDEALGKGVHILLADDLALAIKDQQDEMVQDKPTKITLEITVMKMNRGPEIAINVTHKIALAPKKGFAKIMYGGVNKTGEVELTSYDRGQYALPFGKNKDAESESAEKEEE